MNKIKFLLSGILFPILITACGSSIFSNANTSIEMVTDALNKQTNLGLRYSPKLPGIAGGNIEGGEVGNFPEGKESVMVYRYSSSDGAKNFEKIAGRNCQLVLVKGLFFFCFKREAPALEKAINDL